MNYTYNLHVLLFKLLEQASVSIVMEAKTTFKLKMKVPMPTW